MRVLVVPSYYGYGKLGDSGIGGVRPGVFFREQAVALARHGHEVSLIYLHFDASGADAVEEIDDCGVRSVFIHADPWRFLNTPRKLFLIRTIAARSFSERPPDVVHAHSYGATPYAAAIAHHFGVPYVVTEHSSHLGTGKLSGLWRFVAIKGYRNAARVIAVSSGMADRISFLTGHAPDVIPNLVSDFFFLPHEEPTEHSRIRLLTIGYCRPNKAWDLLLEAFAVAVAAGIDGELVLGGPCDEPGLAELYELSRRLGIMDRVRFVGGLSRDGVRRHIDECDAFVLASRHETFGIVVAEALARGKPVVMTATDAARDIVVESCGLVVPTDDVSGLAHGIAELSSKISQYDSSQMRRRAQLQFSETAVCARLTEVYHSVCESPG